MSEINLFADESGESGTEPKYYLLTQVFHEQDSSTDDRFFGAFGCFKKNYLIKIRRMLI